MQRFTETRALPHPEERPFGRVSKDEECGASWFETREDALLTMRGREHRRGMHFEGIIDSC
jgi:hypothetical protein